MERGWSKGYRLTCNEKKWFGRCQKSEKFLQLFAEEMREQRVIFYQSSSVSPVIQTRLVFIAENLFAPDESSGHHARISRCCVLR